VPSVSNWGSSPSGGSSSPSITNPPDLAAGACGSGHAGGSADAGDIQRRPGTGGDGSAGAFGSTPGGAAARADSGAAPGTDVTDPATQAGGGGGGGGFYAAGLMGTAGGAGGAPGGGGGGGGASDAGWVAGRGGDGATGELRLTWHFH
jgi:hypothetical protein